MQRLRTKTNGKISDCLTSKQKFSWRINRIKLVKSEKDQSISQGYGDGEKNFQTCDKIRAIASMTQDEALDSSRF